MKPINVYLDTQYFVNLSKVNIDPSLEIVKKFLVEETASKRVIIGYSFPLIFELIRNADEKHKEDRLNKARFIKLLCGRNAHPYPTDLKDGHKLPNNGMWTPSNALRGITSDWLKATFRQGLQKKTDQIDGLNRKQRRRIKSAKGSVEIFRPLHLGPFTKEDFQDIPVPEKIIRERMLERYLKGDISAHVVVAALKQWTVDPENLFEIWYEYSGLENPIERFVSVQFENFSEKIEKMGKSYRELQDAKLNVKQAQRNLRKLSISNPWAANLISEASTKIPDDDIYPDFEELAAEVFGPGRGDIFRNYFSSIIESGIHPKRSDLVDLLHFLYIKDVDLFRCDRGMAHHVGRQPSSFQYKIVASLRDLPARVNELQSRQHNSARNGPKGDANGTSRV